MKNILLLFLFFPYVLISQEQPKVGLVLSGGGAKGFAHIGVLKEIEKAGVQIDYIGGTSMGAIIGGLYASGYSPDQIEKIMGEVDFMSLIQDKVDRNLKPFFMKQVGEKYAITLPIRKGKISLPLGLSKGQNILNFLTVLLSEVDAVDDFTKLPIPFFCITTDIETGKEVVVESGSLPLAMRASGAFPSLLNPVDIDGKLMVDGGVVNNFPVDIMLEKDVDIIIGVNVQGKLLKREKLTSVASLLLQIINFQMYEKEDKHVELLDVSLRPNIKDYGVLSFNKGKQILEEGQLVAKPFENKFDSIARLQTIKKKRKLLSGKETFFKLNSIDIEGNQKYTENYILGKMHLEQNDIVSYKMIADKISALTATNNFNRIDYYVTNYENIHVLHLKVKEEEINTFLQLGVHYDLLYETAVLVNYEHKKLLFKNDELSVDLAIGDRVRYAVNYFVDNGLAPSYGFEARYNYFREAFRFIDNENFDDIYIKHRDFTNAVYLQTTLNEISAFGFDFEHKQLKIVSDTFLTDNLDTTFDDSNYLSVGAFLKIDTYDKSVYPTSGFFADFGYQWYFWSDRDKGLNSFSSFARKFRQFSQLSGTFGVAKTFYDKLTLHSISDIGYTLGTIESEVFDFRLGGYNKNYINNFIRFYGYEIGALREQSFIKTEFEARYNVYRNHHAIFIANYARVDSDILKNGKLFTNIKSGYALGYGLDTFIGPIELKYSWSPDTNDGMWLFNLGFWF